jgi:hypothetical protein
MMMLGDPRERVARTGFFERTIKRLELDGLNHALSYGSLRLTRTITYIVWITRAAKALGRAGVPVLRKEWGTACSKRKSCLTLNGAVVTGAGLFTVAHREGVLRIYDIMTRILNGHIL